MGNPKVRIDRGRDYATVHGERGPDDRHAVVHYMQDGLPFDAEGFLIPNHPDLEGNGEDKKRLRALVEKKLRKAGAKSRPAGDEAADNPPRIPQDVKADDDTDDTETADGDPVDGDDGDNDEPEAGDVNLEAWLRGEEQYRWDLVTQRIAQLHHRRVTSKKGAVEFLVEDAKLVPAGVLSPEFKKLLAN